MQLKKGPIIAGIAVVLVIMIAGVVYLLVSRNGGEETTNTNTTVVNTNTTTNTNTTVVNTETPTTEETTEEVVQEVDEEDAILRLARVFTERFGTFSNRNNFENITNLEPFMTTAMQKEQAEYIDANQSDEVPEEYYGITTSVLSTEMIELTETTATVQVQTQRVETTGSEDPVKNTQSMELTFEKVGENWKVSSASWL